MNRTCPRCGAGNPPEFRFCGQCGSPLTDTRTAPRTAEPEPERVAAERRQLTVVFCDLVSSGALAERLDPEDLHQVVRAFQEVCAEAVGRFDGHVAQYLGDGLLVYFGYPEAHEDDPRRAVHAGLEVLEAVAALSRSLEARQGPPLAVRLGIHTGLVVAGEVGSGQRQEQLALGATPNIAARLAAQAEPGTVMVSADTRHLVRRFFEFKSLGIRALKGIARPLELYQPLRSVRPKEGGDRPGRYGRLPLLGRQREDEWLETLQRQAYGGHGRVVVLRGEAGIGKSRLVERVRQRTAAEGAIWLAGGASSFYRNSAFHAVRELLADLFAFSSQSGALRAGAGGEDPLLRVEQVLERRGAALGWSLEEAVPLMAGLLALPPPPNYPPLGLAPPRQKQKSLELLVDLLEVLARERPLTVVIEDLHWADPSTLELLPLLAARAQRAPLFVVLTCRDPFEPPLNPPIPTPGAEPPEVAILELERLDDTAAEALISHLVGGKTLSAELLHQLLRRADGVPLFLEELTKAVLESGVLREEERSLTLTRSLTLLAIPATLQDSLMARLDRLGAAKELAQLAAVCGREFSTDLLRAILPALDSRTATLQHQLHESIDRLLAAELVIEPRDAPPGTFLFRHALIQEAAYESLLKSTRRQVHESIAHALETDFSQVAAESPEQLGRHYSAAGLGERALPFWQRAGQVALQRSANLEAMGHLEHALEELSALPESPERDRLELDLQSTLGPAISAVKGFAAPEVERVYSRALDLQRRAGETAEQFWILWGLWGFFVVRADLDQALELGRRLVRMGEARQDPALRMEGHFAAGSTLYFRGDFAAAERELDLALALDSPDRDRSHLFITGQDVGVTTLAYSGSVLWHRGRPDAALERCRAAVALARRLEHPFSLAAALNPLVGLHQLRREPAAVLEHAEELIALSRERGFFWAEMGRALVGWAQIEEVRLTGEPVREAVLRQSLEQIRHGLAVFRAAGARLSQTGVLSLLAEACLLGGLEGEAAKALDEADEAVEAWSERFWQAELQRLRGELALARGDVAAAEASLRKALATARRQGSAAFELRAATRLARLLAARGEEAAAREPLKAAVGRFSDGWQTVDLREGKEVLDALA